MNPAWPILLLVCSLLLGGHAIYAGYWAFISFFTGNSDTEFAVVTLVAVAVDVGLFGIYFSGSAYGT